MGKSKKKDDSKANEKADRDAVEKADKDVVEKADNNDVSLTGWPMTVAAVCLLLGVWFAFLNPLVMFQFWQPDTFWLIETGRLILDKHCLPTHDPYSFTASNPCWFVYQWLTEILFSLAHSTGGLIGVAVVGEVLLAFLFCVLIFRMMVKDGTNVICAVAAIWLAAYSYFPYLSALRPQLISFVLFWLLARLCADIKTKAKPKQALIVTFITAVFWVNCHISFPIAIILLAAHLAGACYVYLDDRTDRRPPLLFAAMLTIFAIGTLINPHGYAIWPFLVFLRENMIPTPEIQALDWLAQPQLIALVLATLASCIYLRKTIDIGSSLALAAMLIVGNSCGRLIVYFCILSCAPIGKALTQLLAATLRQGPLSDISAALQKISLSRFYPAAILLSAAFIAAKQPVFLRNNIPVQAANYLVDHPVAGKLFCDAQCGSYLIYKTHGDIPVFFDTRLDLYDKTFAMRFIVALNLAEDWKALFAQYKIKAALLPNNVQLQKVIAGQPDWKLIYHDSDFSLYTQNK